MSYYRKPTNPAKDAYIFRTTAAPTKSVNVVTHVMRGGMRF